MTWLPALKASLPYIAKIVSAAVPAFTSKPESSKADPLVAKQIEELQNAVKHNAESLQVLAEKLQQTIQDVESAGARMQKQITVLKIALCCQGALTLVALSIIVWVLPT